MELFITKSKSSKLREMYSTHIVYLYKMEHMEKFITVKRYYTTEQTWKHTIGINTARLVHKLEMLEAHGKVYKNRNV